LNNADSFLTTILEIQRRRNFSSFWSISGMCLSFKRDGIDSLFNCFD
jgi:hypothetical protein